MFLPSLIGTLVLATLSSSAMWVLGRRLARSGNATTVKAVVIAVLWSIPLCWIALDAGGGGHGPSGFPLPAGLALAVLIDSVLKVLSPPPQLEPIHIQALIVQSNVLGVLLLVGLAAPIALFVVSTRRHAPLVDPRSIKIDNATRRRRRTALIVLFTLHLSLTVIAFEGFARWHDSMLSRVVEKGGAAAGEWPRSIHILFSAQDWLGFPLVSLGQELLHASFHYEGASSPLFWFFAIGNSFLVAAAALAIFHGLRSIIARQGRSIA